MPLDRQNAPKLDSYWMPFTANRQFKANPRLLVAAEGMHYTSADGHQVLDGTAGLWCCNAGHGRKRITDAVTRHGCTTVEAVGALTRAGTNCGSCRAEIRGIVDAHRLLAAE